MFAYSYGNLPGRIERSFQAAVAVAVSDGTWYVLWAGGLWLAFYVLFRRRMAQRKVIDREAGWRQMGAEFVRSLRSVAVFGIVTSFTVYMAIGGYTRHYGRIERYGWPWFFASILIAIVLHDAYFYWTHRLMHHPRLYRWMHRTHHLSTNPTPWAAYSFGIAEAFVQAGIGPILAFTIPMHGLAFLAFMTWQIAFNVFGHCGYEIFPHWFLRSWFGYILNTPTHHALHHEKFRGNFGLYFNVWDRLMGTNHPDYVRRFEQATAGGMAAVAEEPIAAPQLAEAISE